ncbi:cobaltochelatase subunit CobN [Methanofollis aquaemaris]|uniref:Cobaltochelatase subunit CobN n=1 Tax=Methanofollis aquaemaris TaxID=126734 RepID=A0A8A3S8J3_9EURY|nr:cobaltochelatase subunit CobN [Methanofollis aquaemaris]
MGWGSELPLFREAAAALGLSLRAWAVNDLKADPALRAACRKALGDAALVLLHPSGEAWWDEVMEGLGAGTQVVAYGYNDTYWSVSTVSMRVVAALNAYYLYGGAENIKNLLASAANEVLGCEIPVAPLEPTLWEGIYHPDAPEPFTSTADYHAWRPGRHRHTVGLLFSRTAWLTRDLAVVDGMIREFERDCDVIPVFCFGTGDRETGALSSAAVIETYLAGEVDALVEARSFIHAADAAAYEASLTALGLPVIHPLVLYHTTEEAWASSRDGMGSSELGWCVALPEFQGMIEMLPVGVAAAGDDASHVPLPERIGRVADRARAWIALRDKPPAERKVAFILHNKPCASLEGGVGAGAHLDTLESVARVLQAMAGAGYRVEAPVDGEELIKTILSRKALSEFRWTSVAGIVQNGGALDMIELDRYMRWFSSFPETVRREIVEAWGPPPGGKDGVPPAMVYDGKIVVTGVLFGNAVVCVQPKRGCAGSRCDGEVCRILHNPEIPPTHQYLATYRWLEEEFGADAVVHVGTHGNLEFLPGKSVALSESCYPDLVIRRMPHLYIYNADNPPEGTTAKRRACATLVDHAQAAMVESGLYGSLKELERQIDDYRRAEGTDGARAHALTHTIRDLIDECGLAEEIGLPRMEAAGAPFEEIVAAVEDVLTATYDARIPDGMHIFGEMPAGERKAAYIAAIMHHEGHLRDVVLRMMGADLENAGPPLLEEADSSAVALVAALLEGAGSEDAARRALNGRLKDLAVPLDHIAAEVADLSGRIDATDEIGALLRALGGGFVPPGPSGLITRGKPEVLPTGRNFYSLDPYRVPTKAAWRVGSRLADLLLAKYIEDEGAYPENVAMYWMASDIMWADGEQCAQVLALLGCEPVWKEGKVRSFRLLSLEELGRPRIDVTVRVSGILRDNFYTCIELIDDAVRAVAALDEPPEMNYVRKHTLASGSVARIFGSRPGTYGNGVSLAIYASAWEDEADIAEVFLRWNGYAYGRGSFGNLSDDGLSAQLASVDLTFNKTATDEYDLLGCCCYFGTHGGLTAAARSISGHDVPALYGDTRDENRPAVRTLADEVRRVTRTKLLNPKWIEGMRRHGYKGAGDMSRRIGTVYGWEATTQEVDDRIFDEITRTYVLDPEMREFFEKENPWAFEEIGRRLLEAYGRGLWAPSEEIAEGLKAAYLEAEGWMEDAMDSEGEVQGGAIHAMALRDLPGWKERK